MRNLLEDLFGPLNFRAEIIWTYRRWSNSAKGLLPAHQTIYYYTKSKEFTFNPIFLPYSATTNIDQILQKRARDEHGVSVYARAEDGTVLFGSEKNGVPLSDVWDIPFLNPKARERTGYPTQKPLLLLERIVRLSTNEEDVVLDPFCGSGTTLVAASLLKRRYIGIDSSPAAIALTKSRLEFPIKSDSAVLTYGRASYQTVNQDALTLLQGLDVVPVQRNAGIDAFFRTEKTLIPIKVQRYGETLADAASKLHLASKSKSSPLAILVRTQEEDGLLPIVFPPSIIVIDSTALSVRRGLSNAIKHFADAVIRNVETT